jgi:Protein of unknown function (DUF3987)
VVDAIRAPIDQYQDSERERLEPEFRRLFSERKSKVAAIKKLRKRLSVESADGLAREMQRIAELEAEVPEEPHRITLTTSDTTPEALEELMQENGGCMAVIRTRAQCSKSWPTDIARNPIWMFSLTGILAAGSAQTGALGALSFRGPI